jgi:hypothetical protein
MDQRLYAALRKWKSGVEEQSSYILCAEPVRAAESLAIEVLLVSEGLVSGRRGSLRNGRVHMSASLYSGTIVGVQGDWLLI